MIADTQYAYSQSARSAEEVIREKLADVLRQLADPDIEPAAQVALNIEAAKLRRLLRVCFQPEGVK